MGERGGEGERGVSDRLDRGYATASAEARRLFDPAFLGKLEVLRIVSRRAFAGVQPASRRGLRAGAGMEFAEHRPYVAGDDFRYLDWAAYGRLGKLLLRLFQQDEDLHIALAVDASASMAVGRPPKLDTARRIAAALAYVGLANLDRIRLSIWADGETAHLRARRGRGQIFRLLDFLAAAPTGGPTDLAHAAEDLLRRTPEKGLVVVLSDFLDDAGRPADAPPGYESALGRLHHDGREVWAIQVEAPEEADPPWRGEVELADAETGAAVRLRATPERIAAYRERRQRFQRAFDCWTTERGIAHLRTRSDVDVEHLVLDVFRRGGFIK